MNEKSPRSPFNGPSRVSDGIVPSGRTRGGPATKLLSINPKYDAATIRTNHKGWQKILFCVIEITGARIVHSQNQDLWQDSPYQSTTKLNPQIQQFWLYITRCILEHLLFCALITCYISEMYKTGSTAYLVHRIDGIVWEGSCLFSSRKAELLFEPVVGSHYGFPLTQCQLFRTALGQTKYGSGGV